MKIDEVFVAGRNPATARALLEAAEAVGEDPTTVRTSQGGYIVSEAIAARYEGRDAGSPDRTYEDLTKAELVALAEDRGLAVSGTKSDLIERLREQEENPAGTEPEGTSEDEKE